MAQQFYNKSYSVSVSEYADDSAADDAYFNPSEVITNE